ncbi:MAG TPA: IMP dehydrogenase, partial [Kribbella sp.]
MRFHHDRVPEQDLTFSDVFLVPNRSAVASRLDVDLSTGDGTGASIPIVAANMTAVSGRRMAETIARCGGLAVIPQDIPVEVVAEVVSWIKDRHTIYDTPLTMTPSSTVGEALNLLPKRGHGAVIVVDGGRAVGVVTDADCEGVDRYTQLEGIMSRELLTLPAGIAAEEAFDQLHDGRHRLAPVVDGDGRIVGILTRQRALRATLYEPAVDAHGKLRVAAAIGINGDAEQKAKALLDAGIDVLVIDTAHGHQERMLEVLRVVRGLSPQVPVVAGNVVTAEG